MIAVIIKKVSLIIIIIITVIMLTVPIMIVNITAVFTYPQYSIIMITFKFLIIPEGTPPQSGKVEIKDEGDEGEEGFKEQVKSKKEKKEEKKKMQTVKK